MAEEDKKVPEKQPEIKKDIQESIELGEKRYSPSQAPKNQILPHEREKQQNNPNKK